VSELKQSKQNNGIMGTKKKSISREVIGALADAFDKSTLTIQRWVASGNLLLTTDKAKAVFERYGLEFINGKVLEADKELVD
jgi:hypothetical protein